MVLKGVVPVQLGHRERMAFQYQDKLKERFAQHPQVRRIARHRHVPKHIYNAQREKHVMVVSRKRKYAPLLPLRCGPPAGVVTLPGLLSLGLHLSCAASHVGQRVKGPFVAGRIGVVLALLTWTTRALPQFARRLAFLCQ